MFSIGNSSTFSIIQRFKKSLEIIFFAIGISYLIVSLIEFILAEYLTGDNI